MVKHLSAERSFGTYVIPGLKAAKTVDSKTGITDICTSMTPQGMDVTEDSIFVSAYCHTKRHNSVLFEIDKKTGRFVKEIIMPNQTHAGGIAYDNLKQMLWVSDYVDGQAAVSLYTMEALETISMIKRKSRSRFWKHIFWKDSPEIPLWRSGEEIFMQDIFRFPGTVLLTGIR